MRCCTSIVYYPCPGHGISHALPIHHSWAKLPLACRTALLMACLCFFCWAGWLVVCFDSTPLALIVPPLHLQPQCASRQGCTARGTWTEGRKGDRHIQMSGVVCKPYDNASLMGSYSGLSEEAVQRQPRTCGGATSARTGTIATRVHGKLTTPNDEIRQAKVRQREGKPPTVSGIFVLYS